jgi:hypothetical protein
LLSPQTLRELWDEQAAIARHRYDLAQAVDRVERTLQMRTGDLADTVKRLEGSRERLDTARRRIDGFDSPWSRFRNRDTIDTLHTDIHRSNGWVSEYETRGATLRTEITELKSERDRAAAQRDAIRPGLVGRTSEIRSALNADALLCIARVERDPPAYLRGIQRGAEGNERWSTTVGGIEQYRAAYGIDGSDALGPRPSYLDMTRADQYRQLDHSIDQLTPARARDREIDMGIEM